MVASLDHCLGGRAATVGLWDVVANHLKIGFKKDSFKKSCGREIGVIIPTLLAVFVASHIA